MFRSLPRRGLPAVLAAVVALAGASAARAQLAYPPYYPAYPYNPTADYLRGAAAVTQANAQYQLMIQQARLLREQSYQTALETRRRLLEQREYELAMRPTPEQLRERERQQALLRSLNDPPAVEVWSGQALNSVLQAIQKAHPQGERGPGMPLPPDVLPHVNFTTGASYGNIGVFRQGGELHWPTALQGAAFREETTRLEELFRQAVSRAASGAVDDELRAAIGAALQSLSAKVDARVAELTPTQFVQATRYVGELKAAYKALQEPNVERYFSRSWTPRGATVDELVGQMTREGLHFAPSVAGGETAYTVLHQALVAYGKQLGVGAGR